MENQTTIEKEYIIPTKQDPVFQADCDHFGYIETGIWKSHLVGNCTSSTFALDFTEAIVELHQWILDNEWILTEYPKAKFGIGIIDGSVDKNGDAIKKQVYSISVAKAKRLLFK